MRRPKRARKLLPLTPVDAAVWFLKDGRLVWFTFAHGHHAHRIARRLLVLFKLPAVVLPFLWEPDSLA